MRLLLLIMLAMAMTGCSTVSTILKGAGDGLAYGSSSPQPKQCYMSQQYGTNDYQGVCQ